MSPVQGGRWVEKALSIRAVLLDMDGLMLDSEPVYRRAWQSAAAGLGYEQRFGF